MDNQAELEVSISPVLKAGCSVERIGMKEFSLPEIATGAFVEEGGGGVV